MNFVFTCLSHTSTLITYVVHHGIRFGLNFSPLGRNILFCSRRYGFDVDDVFFNKFSYFRNVISSCVMFLVSLLLLKTARLTCYLNAH